MKLYVVDAFAQVAFAGNPAAVCLLDRQMPDEWLQKLAVEMNLSETAFVKPRDSGFDLRWFTPGYEVDLCGHATLATAHVLWTEHVVQPGEKITFHTRSGVLTANSAGDRIELDFPTIAASPCDAPAGLLDALGVQRARFVGQNAFDLLVEVDSVEQLERLQPDFRLLATVPVRGVIVTSQSATPEYDFVSRFFAPTAGIDEDPVTGSAHCCLSDYWGRKLDKSELVAYQASRRGGVVHLRWNEQRTILGGSAVTVVRGRVAGSD